MLFLIVPESYQLDEAELPSPTYTPISALGAAVADHEDSEVGVREGGSVQVRGRGISARARARGAQGRGRGRVARGAQGRGRERVARGVGVGQADSAEGGERVDSTMTGWLLMKWT